MKKKSFKPKEDKAKHDLMIMAKISHFLAWECEGFKGEKERREEEKKRRRRKKEEEKKKKIQVRNISFCMEFMFGAPLLFGTLGFVG